METDKTLSIEDKPADASAVGASFENLYNLESTGDWVVGFIKQNNGQDWNVTTGYLRKANTFGIFNGYFGFTIQDGYTAYVFAWEGDTYIGIFMPDGSFATTGTPAKLTKFNCSLYPNYKFKVCILRQPYENVTLSTIEGQNCKFHKLTDTSLKVYGKPADASKVGESLDSLKVKLVNNYEWVNQGFNGSENTARLSAFLSKADISNINEIVAPNGYLIGLGANKYYVWNGSNWSTSNLYFAKKQFLSSITIPASYTTIGFTLVAEDGSDIEVSKGSDVEFYQRAIAFDDIDNSISTSIKVNKLFYANRTLDCDLIESNAINVFNANATLVNGPDNFEDWKDGGNWELRTYGPSMISNTPYMLQYIDKINGDAKKRIAQRVKTGSTWGAWSIITPDFSALAIHVGASYTYTRLRDGIAAARTAGNITVYVHPGTYDLLTEFADEIEAATGQVGIALGNNIHVIFYDGAKVTALFDNSEETYDATTWRWIYTSFQPFYAGSGNFTIENLYIEANDTRYCVHDEMNGSGTYKHEYINCRMTYNNTHSDINYVQCIGGGLGEHGTIIIDGGWYKTTTLYGLSTVGGAAENSQQPISFHNGKLATADSSIIIKNVYLADRGYFRFGWYGSSTIESQVQISGCGVGLPTLVKAEGTASSQNFELTEFGIEKRNAYHWELSPNGQTATLMADS